MTLLPFVVALPLATAASLLIGGRWLERALIVFLSVLSAWVTAAIAAREILAWGGHDAVRAVAWRWIDIGGLSPVIAFQLDALSALMMGVVVFIGAAVLTYATWYLRDDNDLTRFHGLFHLFAGAMLTLCLADDLGVLFAGWEGVGVASFLLIGFWWQTPDNVRAGRKAFVVTRIGDVAMALALFAAWTEAGTLRIEAVLDAAAQGPVDVWAGIAVLLWIGALGKSGQFPFQVWLPDAMAGPTPVSAMLHAATMVVAGVYLLARTSPLLAVDPMLGQLVMAGGAVTLLFAGLAALGQTDLKRVLAWSTVSQIGYMFVGLGAGAPAAAMFHFTTHAFFKALLFLTAGLVIEALHHVQDIRKMGGLRSQLPFAHLMFVVGGASLAALPPFSGFFSKDGILEHALHAPGLGPVAAAAGVIGSALTAAYVVRTYQAVFGGAPHADHPAHDASGLLARVPVAGLAVLAIAAGALPVPGWLGVASEGGMLHALTTPIAAVSVVAALIGGGWAWRATAAGVGSERPFLASGLGVDALYDTVLARPFLGLVGTDRQDPLASLDRGLGLGIDALAGVNQRTQDGRVRRTLFVAVATAVALIAWWEVQ
jgi:NADH-quinone oxidoreductase subunit L